MPTTGEMLSDEYEALSVKRAADEREAKDAAWKKIRDASFPADGSPPSDVMFHFMQEMHGKIYSGTPSYADPVAFAKSKAEKLVAAFPDTTDAEIDEVLRWGIEQKKINDVRTEQSAASGRRHSEAGTYEAMNLGQKAVVQTGKALMAAEQATPFAGQGETLARGLGATDEDVKATQEVMRSADVAAPFVSGLATTAGTIGGYALNPAMRAGAAIAGAAGAGPVGSAAAGFAAADAAAQLGREVTGTATGPGTPTERILGAGQRGAVTGLALGPLGAPARTVAGGVAKGLAGAGVLTGVQAAEAAAEGHDIPPVVTPGNLATALALGALGGFHAKMGGGKVATALSEVVEQAKAEDPRAVVDALLERAPTGEVALKPEAKEALAEIGVTPETAEALVPAVIDAAREVKAAEPAPAPPVEAAPTKHEMVSAEPVAPALPAPKADTRSADAIEKAATGRSLSQFVRSQGGINAESSGMTGEVERLGVKASRTTGLIRRDGGGLSAENMLRSARESGYPIPEDATPADFLDMLEMDATGRGRALSEQTSDLGALADVEFRRAAERGEVPREPPPAPTETAPGETVYSTKNRIVNEKRVARGLPEIEGTRTRSHQSITDEAERVLAEDPGKAYRLVDELASDPRPHTDLEVAILTRHYANLEKAAEVAMAEGVKAFEAGDEAGRLQANKEFSVIEAELKRTDLADTESGADTARGLGARRMEMLRDYSLKRVMHRARAARGFAPLDVETATKLKNLADEVARLQGEVDAGKIREAEAKARAVEEAVLRPSRTSSSSTSKRYGSKNTLVTTERYEKVRAEVRAKLSQLNVGIPLDPALIKGLVEMGVYHVEAGAHSFAEWAAKMTDKMTDKERRNAEPHLLAVYEEANKQSAGKVIDEVKGAIKAREGNELPIHEISRLAEMFTRTGVRDMDTLVEQVHEIVKSIDPNVTIRETRDAISGYGRLRALNKDEAKVALRELKGQMQQVSKLEDMKAGGRPLKSGIERQAPGPIQRELIKEVNAQKQKTGNDVEQQIATVERSIAEYEKRLEKGDVFPEKADVNPTQDPRLDALRKKRDELRQKVEDIRASVSPHKSETQRRLEAAVKATEKSIEEWERRVAAGDVFSAAKEKGPSTAKLDELRARRDALRQQAKDIAASVTTKSDYEVALQTVKTRLKNRIAELQDRLKSGDLQPAKKEPLRLDSEGTKLQAQANLAKQAIDEAIYKERMANRTPAEKARDAAREAYAAARTIKTSFDLSAVGRQNWWNVVTHPIESTVKAFKPMIEALRSNEGQARVQAVIEANPLHAVAKKIGVSFTETNRHAPITAQEEAFQGHLAQKIPGVSHSERAFVTYLNWARMQAFERAYKALSKGGKQPSKAQLEHIAAFVNSSTGRGGGKNPALAGAAAWLWSPRLMASRVALLLGKPLWTAPKGNRAYVAGEYARAILAVGAIYTALKAVGAEIEGDPTSSDFAKVRMGDTRVDPAGGFQQYGVLGARLATGEKKNLRGRTVDLVDGRRGDDTTSDVITRFFRSKLAPLPGTAWDLLAHEDVVGNKVTPGTAARDFAMPLTFKDIYQVMTSEQYGVPSKAALTLLSLFGIGVSTYETGAKKQK